MKRIYRATDFHLGYCLKECYDDRTYPETALCRGGKKVRRMKPSKSGYAPGWCPRRASVEVNIYQRLETRRSLLFEAQEQYVLAYSFISDMTPYWLYKHLCDKNTDLCDLMGGYSLNSDDIVEMSNGLVTHVIKHDGQCWTKISTVPSNTDYGEFEGIRVKVCSHALRYYYREDSAHCGVVRGYFGGKSSLSWEGEISSREAMLEFEHIFTILGGQGFLKDFEGMESFCYRRPAAYMPDGAMAMTGAYCFYVDGHHARFFIRCRFDQDENYPVSVVAHPT